MNISNVSNLLFLIQIHFDISHIRITNLFNW